MKRILGLLFICVIIYATKPYWEKPVSQYIDLSFLAPVDAKVEIIRDHPIYQDTVHLALDTIDKVEQFIRSSDDNTPSNSTISAPVDAQKTKTKRKESEYAVELQIGDAQEDIQAEHGQPVITAANEYGTEWYSYHQDYNDFLLVSYSQDGQVNGFYSNDELISSISPVTYGATKQTVRDQFGEPLTEIQKGRHIFRLDPNRHYDVFEHEQSFLYVFYDVHQQTTVTAVQVIAKTLEEQKVVMYEDESEALQEGFEILLFQLTNASRVRNGLSPLSWEDQAAQAAVKHSKDMAQQHYFSHENLQGMTPFDRMEAEGIYFQSAGENLAYGQTSSIFAHEGLMNSEGHRKNILHEDFTHLGIGVSFNEQNQPYFTENFLTPRQ